MSDPLTELWCRRSIYLVHQKLNSIPFRSGAASAIMCYALGGKEVFRREVKSGMSSLSTLLAKLDESIRVLETQVNRVGAGLDVARDEFVQNVNEARQHADAVREALCAQDPDVKWTNRESLDDWIRELKGAEAGRNQQRIKKLLDLAEELNGGTITHRLKSRVAALEELRQGAVCELRAEAAKEHGKEIPGPRAAVWLHWACGLQGDASASAAQLLVLERDFPAVVQFLGEMEESYWQPRPPSDQVREQVARAETPSLEAAMIERQRLQLAQAAPVFAAKYGHLSAAKAAAQTDIAAEASTTDAKSELAAPAQSSSEAAPLAAGTEIVSSPLAESGSVAHRATATVEPSGESSARPLLEAKDSVFSLYAAEPVSSHGEANRGFRFNSRVLITVGATAAIGLVVVVTSAVSRNLTGKHSGSPPAIVANASAKEAASSSAAPVSDLELVGQIEDRLKAMKGSSIYVTVQHGTAILEGKVPSAEALATAEELTLQSSQIKVVRNRLQIESPAASHAASRPTKADAGGNP